MIATPINLREAASLTYSDNAHLLGNILYRLVFAGAKQEASYALDFLSQPLEQYMTGEKCLHLGYVEKLGLDWMRTRDHYYERSAR